MTLCVTNVDINTMHLRKKLLIPVRKWRMTTASQRQNAVGLVLFFQVHHLCRCLFRPHQGVTRTAFCASAQDQN